MAHWIASYFRDDPFMKRLPKTVEEAQHAAEVQNAWVRKRFPGMLGWLNESFSADIPFFKFVHILTKKIHLCCLSHRSLK